MDLKGDLFFLSIKGIRFDVLKDSSDGYWLPFEEDFISSFLNAPRGGKNDNICDFLQSWRGMTSDVNVPKVWDAKGIKRTKIAPR